MDDQHKQQELKELGAKFEIRAASNWWTDRLRDPSKPADPNGEPLLSLGRALTSEPLPYRVLADFNDELFSAITVMLHERNVAWDHANPTLGSIQRIVSCDWGPDKTLQVALDAAGLSRYSLQLPVKTVMWINPGLVTVRVGYGTPIVTVYSQ